MKQQSGQGWILIPHFWHSASTQNLTPYLYHDDLDHNDDDLYHHNDHGHAHDRGDDYDDDDDDDNNAGTPIAIQTRGIVQEGATP